MILEFIFPIQNERILSFFIPVRFTISPQILMNVLLYALSSFVIQSVNALEIITLIMSIRYVIIQNKNNDFRTGVTTTSFRWKITLYVMVDF